MSVISNFHLYNSCKATFFKTWSSNYTSINNNNTIINHNWQSRFHTSINCLPVFLWQLDTDRYALADDKTYLYFTDYWFLLRYTVIIYKFSQGNLGAKQIVRSRFQSPVKKKIRKLRHWRPTTQSLHTCTYFKVTCYYFLYYSYYCINVWTKFYNC